MRWFSLCAVLGAVLLPAVNALPCRPDTTVTTTSATTTSTSEPTASIYNGDFEGEDLSVWQERTVTIENDSTKAASGSHYAKFAFNNQYGSGGNHLNQTINGLDTSRMYRLSFSGAVLGLPPTLGSATCEMQALLGGVVKKSWPISNFVVGVYKSYSTELSVNNEDLTLTLRLRCTDQNKVTIEFGVDDVGLTEITSN
ncbi:hypothetical protein QQZ08_004334 [Neonectria magnoliae]|uniref:CBM-cenC domain-containing protein n=1 Tax=Neonectria magnoliae TaxID=2732573 RepID=A0ABR1I7C3_9HYPO